MEQATRLGDLPHELLVLIAEFVDSEPAINAFCRTSRFIYQCVNPYLYFLNAKKNQDHERTRWALLWATEHGAEETARLALKPYKTLGLNSIVPQMMAARKGHEKVMSLFISTDTIELDARTMTGFSALDEAVIYGHSAVVKCLLDAGASPEPTSEVWRMESLSIQRLPLYMAIDKGHSNAIRTLASSPLLDLEKKSKEGWTPLSHACRRGNVEVVKSLLDCGANPDPVFHHVVAFGPIEIVKLFLAHGADVNQVDKNGRTPIYRGISYPCYDRIQLLLERGAGLDLNHVDTVGYSPLSWAIDHLGSSSRILLLLASQKGVDPNIGDAFPWAIVRGCVKLATALLAMPLLTSSSKYEGLRAAIMRNWERTNSLIRPILECGVEFSVDERESLLKCASDVGNGKALELLEETYHDNEDECIWLKAVLESPTIPKVFFDIRSDSDALYSHYNISVTAIIDIQLLELATRGHSINFVTGLSKCIQKDSTASATVKAIWQRAKDSVSRLYDPDKGGNFDVFNERPLRPEIVQYCKQDVEQLPSLREVYGARLRVPGKVYWRHVVRDLIKERIKLSQSKNYDGQAKSKVCGPWDEHIVYQAIEEWNDEVQMEQENARPRMILNEDDEWVERIWSSTEVQRSSIFTLVAVI